MRTPSFIIATLITTSLVVLAAPAARADLVVGNLTSGNDFGHQTASANTEFASPFTLGGAFTPVDLESITLHLRVSSGTATVGVSLWSSVFSLPGSELADLGTVTPAISTFADFVFTPSTAFTLQPNSAYWVVLDKISGDGLVSWGSTNNHAIDPGSDPAANIPQNFSAITFNSGATWQSNTTEHLFSVQSVPEPGAAVLLGLGAMSASARAADAVDRSRP